MTPVVAGFGEETTTQLVDLTKTMRAGALLLVSKLLPQLVNQDVSQPADSGFFEVVLRTRCKMAWGHLPSRSGRLTTATVPYRLASRSHGPVRGTRSTAPSWARAMAFSQVVAPRRRSASWSAAATQT